ncbi:MAG: methyltransferase [Planctomycetes bacterium]|nr:methyltransferase [Planctomycetota bacterium]
MTSRERVLAAIERREPDRVPIDFGGMRSTGIMAVAYGRLLKELGLAGREPRMYDLVQQLAIPDDDVLERFHVDVADLGHLVVPPRDSWKGWTLPDGSPALVPGWFEPAFGPDGTLEIRDRDGLLLAAQPRGCLYVEQTHFPFRGRPAPRTAREVREAMAKVVWAYLPSPPWDRASEPGFWRWLKEAAAKARRATDRAIMVGFGGNLLEWLNYLYSMEESLSLLASDPEEAGRALDLLVEVHLENLEKLLEAVGDNVDLIQMGDDLGSQQAPLISPAMYRRLFKPRHERIFRAVKERSRLKVFLHSCGSIRKLLPDLIDCGIDVVNPVQTSAVGMDPAELKREFGRHVTFWGGGCETQTVLHHGTPDDVARMVRERIETFAPGGGYVFNQVHNVMANVPPRNAIAMLDAAYACGRY